MSDNRHFKLECIDLDLSMKVAFGQWRKATHYKDEDGKRLIFAWTECEGFTKLPTPINEDTAVVVVRDWLENTAVYGGQPDHDGDNTRSQYVYNEGWGHVDHKYQAFVAIEPCWAMHGK